MNNNNEHPVVTATRNRTQTVAEARAAAAIARQQERGTTHRQDATGTAMVKGSETAAAAVAAHAEAMAKARFFVAMQRPRDLERVREQLLAASAEPLFAEDATYELERWDQRKGEKTVIRGFSARFAEAARVALGNLDVETMVVLDDDEKLIVQVIVTDLEANVTERVPVVVRKRIERRKLNRGQVAISQRIGADGQTVHLVAATDDEIQMRLNSAQSKATRNAILRLLRADIRQECWEQVIASQTAAANQEGATGRAVGVFAELGVSSAQLAAFLGHEITGELDPAELTRLRGVARALRDGEVTWAEVVESAGTHDSSVSAQAPSVKDDQLRRIKDACALSLIEFDEVARQVVKLCGGKEPMQWEDLTILQMTKVEGWLAKTGRTQ